jgi:glycerol kinase
MVKNTMARVALCDEYRTKAIASKNNLLTTIAWQIDGKTNML